MRLDADELKADADAHEESLRGPLWQSAQGQRVQRLCRAMGVSESEAREALENVGWDHQRAADWLRRFTQIRGGK
jgi:predicted metal-binding transcription factor (methanogenesis marker protein 9)